MARIVFCIFAVVASFMLVESLKCNKCSFGLVGLCLIPSEETCSDNSSVCSTEVATFPSLSSFSGFNTQGCRANSTGCNMTTTQTFLGVSYNDKVNCCSTDKCNPISTSGAPSTKMTVTTAMGAALLVSMLGSML